LGLRDGCLQEFLKIVVWISLDLSLNILSCINGAGCQPLDAVQSIAYPTGMQSSIPSGRFPQRRRRGAFP